MKLRNKKTGEIGELLCNPSVIDRYFVANDKGNYSYNSLAELNEEWEDYEEPKDDYIRVIESFINYVEEADESFYCDETVQKFVEKLKAWKRLKDKGFKFTGWHGHYMDWDEGEIRFRFNDYKFDEIGEDLTFLFGGEE